jgi:hypothetical protein
MNKISKKVLWVCIALLLVGIYYACQQHGYVAPEKLFLEKLHAIETAVPPIWPGFSSAKAPLILRFGDGALLVGLKPKVACGFRPVKDFFPDISKAPKNSFFKPGYFEPWLQSFNVESFKSCAGEVHFSNYNLMEGILCRDILFHEYFHSYQKRNFKWRYGRQVFSHGFSPRQAAAAYIEQIILSKALSSTGQNWKYYARAFSALRLYKKNLPDPYSLNPREDALEAIEGSAVYFETRTRDFDMETPSELQSKRKNRVFPTQADLHIAGELLMTEFSPGLMLYWRQYNTGAAQGLLMDRAEIDWKTGVQNGKSIFSFFSTVFAVPKTEQSKLVDTIKLEYDYNTLVSVANKTMFPRKMPFARYDYSGKIIIRTCGNPSIEAKEQSWIPKFYRFKDGSIAEPFQYLKIRQKNAFDIDINRFGALADLKENSLGKNCRHLEIYLLIPPSQLSIDKTNCVQSSEGFICKRLAFYGSLGDEAHFNVPVRLTEEGKILILEVLP